MEYCKGGELFDRIAKLGNFSEWEAMKIDEITLSSCELFALIRNMPSRSKTRKFTLVQTTHKILKLKL